MFSWRISIFGRTPAIPLGTVTAPDEASARQQAIDFYSIAPAVQGVAIKLGKAKAKEAVPAWDG